MRIEGVGARLRRVRVQARSYGGLGVAVWVWARRWRVRERGSLLPGGWLAYGQTVAYRGRMLWFVLVLATILWGILRPEGPHEPFPYFAVWLHVLAFLALGLSGRLAFSGWPGAWIWPPLLLARASNVSRSRALTRIESVLARTSADRGRATIFSS